MPCLSYYSSKKVGFLANRKYMIGTMTNTPIPVASHHQANVGGAFEKIAVTALLQLNSRLADSSVLLKSPLHSTKT